MQQSHSPIGHIVSFCIFPLPVFFTIRFLQFCSSSSVRPNPHFLLPFVFPSEEGCPLCVKLMGRSLSNPHVGIAYYGGTQMCFTVTTNILFLNLDVKVRPSPQFPVPPHSLQEMLGALPRAWWGWGSDYRYILRNSRNLVPKSQPLIASICSARARLGFGSGKRHKAINWQCHALCLRNERMSEGVGYFWGCFIASFSPNRILEFMAWQLSKMFYFILTCGITDKFIILLP